MRTKSLLDRRAALALFALALGACGGNACDRPQPFESSTERGALRVPEDLSEPASSGKYQLPDAGAGQPVRGPCGDAPPLRDVQVEEKPPAPATGVALSAPPPSNEAAVSSAVEAEVTTMVEAWLSAWGAADAPRYLSFYAANFEPPVTGEPLDVWRDKRHALLAATGPSDMRYDRLQITESGSGATARFIQEFHTDGQINAVVKELDLVREDGAWKIQRERIAEVL